jgi:hypothetical protein
MSTYKAQGKQNHQTDLEIAEESNIQKPELSIKPAIEK